MILASFASDAISLKSFQEEESGHRRFGVEFTVRSGRLVTYSNRQLAEALALQIFAGNENRNFTRSIRRSISALKTFIF